MLQTKSEKINKDGVGAIVARFQAPIHQGHRDLIDSVVARHDKTIIVLGISPTGTSTMNNPLDYDTRRLMMHREYPNALIMFQRDNECDIQWSRELDDKLATVTTVGSKVTLYGSRDSFVKHYHGKHDIKVLEPECDISSTEVRSKLRETADKNHPQFIEGAIHSTQNQYPTAYPCVDIAIIDRDKNRILLGRKPNETLWRFPGGFVDPEKGNMKFGAMERNAKREAMEETGLEVDNLTYVGTRFIDDWRYRGERDAIVTTFFTADFIYGVAKAGDDLEVVQWFDFNSIECDRGGNITKDMMIKGHGEMLEYLHKQLKN